MDGEVAPDPSIGVVLARFVLLALSTLLEGIRMGAGRFEPRPSWPLGLYCFLLFPPDLWPDPCLIGV